MNTTKIYIAIDLQNDFIDGVFGTNEAKAIVAPCIEFLASLNRDDLVIFTQDTHRKDEETLEKTLLPAHCLISSNGWEINQEIFDAKKGKKEIQLKPTFCSSELVDVLKNKFKENNLKEEEVEFILFGLCTDICVISNALTLRSNFLNTKISVIESLSAGTSKMNHDAALKVLRANLIDII